MSEHQRPRARAAQEGWGALNDRELIALLLVHNHPSGNPQPSDADRRLTSTLCEAGKHLDLPVLDHVIVAGKAFVSFADQGWLP